MTTKRKKNGHIDVCSTLDKLFNQHKADCELIQQISSQYAADLAAPPNDDELNYLAALSDYAALIRSAAILNHRANYFYLHHNVKSSNYEKSQKS